MFARSERRRTRALENLKIQSLSFASFSRDIADGRFGHAIHNQTDAVHSGFQLRIVVTTISRCVDFSDFVCIAALDADFSALNRTFGTFHDPAKSSLSGLNSQQ